MTGWWLSHLSEKYEFVSWDDSSQYMENHLKKKHGYKPPISHSYSITGGLITIKSPLISLLNHH